MGRRERFTEFRDDTAAARRAREIVVPAEHAADDERPSGPVYPALVMGLGNPGAQYGNTRHNVGAWCVNLLARRHRVELERAGRVDRAVITIDGRQLVIARPRSYMNESGPPIAAEVKRMGVDPRALVVIYDELDLPVGRVRMRLQGGHGGNNGMRSIIAALGTPEFARIRIGIDRPYDDGRPVREPDRVAGWVLSAPSPGDRRALEAAVVAVADAIERAARDGLAIAMERLNAGPDPGAGAPGEPGTR